MDRAAGYGPASEGSTPSPNANFEPKIESYYVAQKPLGHLLARFPASVARPILSGVAWLAANVRRKRGIAGPKPVLLTISKG